MILSDAHLLRFFSSQVPACNVRKQDNTLAYKNIYIKWEYAKNEIEANSNLREDKGYPIPNGAEGGGLRVEKVVGSKLARNR